MVVAWIGSMTGWRGFGAALVAVLCYCCRLAAPSAHAATLDAVRERGHVVCGVSEGVPGFSAVASNGTWTGLDVDFCGAVAVAVLGHRDAVKYRALTPANRFHALKNGEVDLVSQASTWTLTRDTDLGARYAGTASMTGRASSCGAAMPSQACSSFRALRSAP